MDSWNVQFGKVMDMDMEWNGIGWDSKWNGMRNGMNYCEREVRMDMANGMVSGYRKVYVCIMDGME